MNHEWVLRHMMGVCLSTEPGEPNRASTSWRCKVCGERETTEGHALPSEDGCSGEPPAETPHDAVRRATRTMLTSLLAIDWSTVTEEDARSAWDAACEDVGRPDLKLGAPVPLGFAAGLQLGKLLRKERE